MRTSAGVQLVRFEGTGATGLAGILWSPSPKASPAARGGATTSRVVLSCPVLARERERRNETGKSQRDERERQANGRGQEGQRVH